MCYSSSEGWHYYRKDAVQEAEERGETGAKEAPEPQVQAEESRMWAYIAKLEESADLKPDRISEKV
ncbi:hypothetical protein J7E83_17215 [Arthrobacter sp. ISL-48]|uniref:hypothetical protein n=1 Tax=Arthrobacter sp. ISL-48 TaxID=2819110 RepID=UPI001BE9D3AE|nr:hypothetical protein [Arthrobacter sp. ISL-48]MBT2533833.1 hypothetical protein [Arthrobacter sp. ISL-48]